MSKFQTKQSNDQTVNDLKDGHAKAKDHKTMAKHAGVSGEASNKFAHSTKDGQDCSQTRSGMSLSDGSGNNY